MTLRYLLDTSIVSSPISRAPNPEILKRLEKHGHESAIAAPVWHELTYGWHRFLAGNDELLLKPIWRTSYKHPFPFCRTTKQLRPGMAESGHDWKISVGRPRMLMVRSPRSLIPAA